MPNEGTVKRKIIPHTKECKRQFLRFDPDCGACIAIKDGKQPRMTKAQAFAMLVRKGYR